MSGTILLLNNKAEKIYVHLVFQAIPKAIRYPEVRQQIRGEAIVRKGDQVGGPQRAYLSLARPHAFNRAGLQAEAADPGEF